MFEHTCVYLTTCLCHMWVFLRSKHPVVVNVHVGKGIMSVRTLKPKVGQTVTTCVQKSKIIQWLFYMLLWEARDPLWVRKEETNGGNGSNTSKPTQICRECDIIDVRIGVFMFGGTIRQNGLHMYQDLNSIIQSHSKPSELP